MTEKPKFVPGEAFLNATFTFSKNCCSGIAHHLPEGKCGCWRCRDERGEPHDEETERQAEERSKVARAAFEENLRSWRKKQRSS